MDLDRAAASAGASAGGAASTPSMAAAAAPAPAGTIVNAVASSFVVWPRSELLGVGDDPVPHWAKVLLMATAQGTFNYPAGHPRAGQLDESAAGVFKSWLMTTVEPDLMADTMSLMGPGNSEEEKLNGAEFRVPDDLPPHGGTFENATALQCRNHLSRKCAEAVTVSSMVQDMKGDDFDPEKEELGAWFDALARKRSNCKIKSAVSLRKFFDMVDVKRRLARCESPILYWKGIAARHQLNRLAWPMAVWQ